MIPYVDPGTLILPGGISVEPYGPLAAAAVVAGLGFSVLRAPRHALDRGLALRALWWTAIVGLVSGFIGDLVFYQPGRLAAEGPAALLGSDVGLSSLSGMLGGLCALGIYARWTGAPTLRLFDLLAECFVLGWLFGRLGCALAHDHPGQLSAFPLAVAFPGGARHDLGLYEWLFTLLVLAPALWWQDRRGAPEGARLILTCCLYGPVRFLLDFLRASDLPGSDPRYAGLTAAQYGCVAITAIGAALWMRLSPGWRRRAAVE